MDDETADRRSRAHSGMLASGALFLLSRAIFILPALPAALVDRVAVPRLREFAGGASSSARTDRSRLPPKSAFRSVAGGWPDDRGGLVPQAHHGAGFAGVLSPAILDL